MAIRSRSGAGGGAVAPAKGTVARPSRTTRRPGASAGPPFDPSGARGATTRPATTPRPSEPTTRGGSPVRRRGAHGADPVAVAAASPTTGAPASPKRGRMVYHLVPVVEDDVSESAVPFPSSYTRGTVGTATVDWEVGAAGGQWHALPPEDAEQLEVAFQMGANMVERPVPGRSGKQRAFHFKQSDAYRGEVPACVEPGGQAVPLRRRESRSSLQQRPPGFTAYSANFARRYSSKFNTPLGGFFRGTQPVAQFGGCEAACAEVVSTGHVWTGERDGTLRLWDARSHEQVYTTEQKRDFFCASLLEVPAETAVWGGFSDGAIRIFNARHPYDVRMTLRRHTTGSTVYCLAPQIGGHCVFSGGQDNMIFMWDSTTLQWMRSFSGHARAVRCLLADADQLLSGSDDGTVAMWDVYGRDRVEWAGHDAGVHHLVRSDRHIWTGGEDGAVRVWDFATGDCVQVYTEPHQERIHAMALIGDKVWTTSGTAVFMWDARTLQSEPVGKYPNNHTGYIMNIVEVHRSLVVRVWTTGKEGKVQVWDTECNADFEAEGLRQELDRRKQEIVALKERVRALSEDHETRCTELEHRMARLRGENADLTAALTKHAGDTATTRLSHEQLSKELDGLRQSAQRETDRANALARELQALRAASQARQQGRNTSFELRGGQSAAGVALGTPDGGTLLLSEAREVLWRGSALKDAHGHAVRWEGQGSRPMDDAGRAVVGVTAQGVPIVLLQGDTPAVLPAGPGGAPLRSHDGRPVVEPLGRRPQLEDGTRVLCGPDGRPISTTAGKVGILSHSGLVTGPDGKAVLGPDGRTQIHVDGDGGEPSDGRGPVAVLVDGTAFRAVVPPGAVVDQALGSRSRTDPRFPAAGARVAPDGRAVAGPDGMVLFGSEGEMLQVNADGIAVGGDGVPLTQEQLQAALRREAVRPHSPRRALGPEPGSPQGSPRVHARARELEQLLADTRAELERIRGRPDSPDFSLPSGAGGDPQDECDSTANETEQTGGQRSGLDAGAPAGSPVHPLGDSQRSQRSQRSQQDAQRQPRSPGRLRQERDELRHKVQYLEGQLDALRRSGSGSAPEQQQGVAVGTADGVPGTAGPGGELLWRGKVVRDSTGKAVTTRPGERPSDSLGRPVVGLTAAGEPILLPPEGGFEPGDIAPLGTPGGELPRKGPGGEVLWRDRPLLDGTGSPVTCRPGQRPTDSAGRPVVGVDDKGSVILLGSEGSFSAQPSADPVAVGTPDAKPADKGPSGELLWRGKAVVDAKGSPVTTRPGERPTDSSGKEVVGLTDRGDPILLGPGGAYVVLRTADGRPITAHDGRVAVEPIGGGSGPQLEDGTKVVCGPDGRPVVTADAKVAIAPREGAPIEGPEGRGVPGAGGSSEVFLDSRGRPADSQGLLALHLTPDGRGMRGVIPPGTPVDQTPGRSRGHTEPHGGSKEGFVGADGRTVLGPDGAVVVGPDLAAVTVDASGMACAGSTGQQLTKAEFQKALAGGYLPAMDQASRAALEEQIRQLRAQLAQAQAQTTQQRELAEAEAQRSRTLAAQLSERANAAPGGRAASAERRLAEMSNQLAEKEADLTRERGELALQRAELDGQFEERAAEVERRSREEFEKVRRLAERHSASQRRHTDRQKELLSNIQRREDAIRTADEDMETRRQSQEHLSPDEMITFYKYKEEQYAHICGLNRDLNSENAALIEQAKALEEKLNDMDQFYHERPHFLKVLIDLYKMGSMSHRGIEKFMRDVSARERSRRELLDNLGRMRNEVADVMNGNKWLIGNMFTEYEVLHAGTSPSFFSPDAKRFSKYHPSGFGNVPATGRWARTPVSPLGTSHDGSPTAPPPPPGSPRSTEPPLQRSHSPTGEYSSARPGSPLRRNDNSRRSGHGTGAHSDPMKLSPMTEPERTPRGGGNVVG